MSGERWPRTSDKEFSKRVCTKFMWAYFLHIALTLGVVWLGRAYPGAHTLAGDVLDLFGASQPVYMLVFGAVIAKSGVENVYKGKVQHEEHLHAAGHLYHTGVPEHSEDVING